MPRSPVHQTVAALLRQARLLGAADWLQYRLLQRSSAASRRLFQHRYGAEPLPPDALAYDAYGFLNWEQYWESGLETARLLSSILQRESSGGAAKRVLEWGCGPGRIVRHMPGLLRTAGQWEVVGSDYNPATVRWCRSSIVGVTFIENCFEPPLQCAPGSFDAVYGISVFTHLSEALQHAWAEEVHRVLRPDGLLIASFHGDAARSYLRGAELRRYDDGIPVIRGHVPEGKRTFVSYHPPEYVRALLGPQFEITDRRTGPVPSLGVHDLYVARKRPA